MSEKGGATWALMDALRDAPVGIGLLDRKLRFVHLNHTLARMANRPAEELLGRSVDEVMAGIRPWQSEELRKVIETGEPATGLALSGASPAGAADLRHWSTSYHPARTGEGEVFGVIVVASDVTDRQNAEQAAQQAQNEAERAVQALMRLQAVTAGLAAAVTPVEVARVVLEEGIGLLDAAAGSISWAVGPDELEILDAFGYPEKSLVAWRRYVVDVPAPLAEAFRTGEPVWLESPEAFAARYPHLAQAARSFSEGASAAMPLRAHEPVVGVLGLSFDAPRSFDPADKSFILALSQQCAQALERARLYEEQKSLRERAEKTAALLDTLFSSVPIGLAFLDWDLRVIHANTAWVQLRGWTSAAWTGKPITELLSGVAGLERASAYRRVLDSGAPALDIETSRPDPADRARVRTWLESWYPVIAGGETIGLGLVAWDITEAKRAEEFRRNVLGIVGHDLRNPLSAIAGFARMLAKGGGLDERQTHLVSRVEAGAAKIERMVHDLLDVTRAQAARSIPVSAHPARADEICASVCEEASMAHPGRVIRCTGRGEPYTQWDADRMSQAISNLVVNALKHGDADSPVAVVWDALDDEVVIRVQNWGPPIPAEERSHLFEPFRQGRQAAAQKSSLGLGLYITREIVRAHGGTIEARSSDAEGTVFTMRLPRRAAAAP
jgi:PAS domain S-box-containing protein